MSSFDHLISGYFRNVTDAEDLYMNVPNEMKKMTLSFYPSLMSFNMFDANNYTVKQHGKFIEGKGNSCNAYCVYVGHDTFMVNGLNEGTHCLSVRNHNHEGSGQCVHSIGVISEKKSEFTTDDHYVYNHFPKGSEDTVCSYFTGFPNYWTNGEVMTVLLDCNKSMVTYFKNGKEVQKDRIKSGLSYFFALHLCASDDIRMEIIDYTIRLKR